MIQINNSISKSIRLISIVCVFFIISLSSCSSMCENEISKSLTSSDGKYTVVSFSRSCGATTGQSWQVSLLKKQKKLPNQPANIFITDKSEFADVFWKNDSELVIVYDFESSEIFKKLLVFDDITIIYQDKFE